MSWEARAQSFRAWMCGTRLSTYQVILGKADSSPVCGRPLTPALDDIRFHRPSACLSLQRFGAWRFWCFPLIALLRQGYSPKGEGYSEASLSPRGEDERSEGEGALPLLFAPVVLAFHSTLTDERR